MSNEMGFIDYVVEIFTGKQSCIVRRCKRLGAARALAEAAELAPGETVVVWDDSPSGVIEKYRRSA